MRPLYLPPAKLYPSQEATVRTRHGSANWFKIGKRVHEGCILTLCLFKLYAEYIMWNAGLGEAQAWIKFARKHSNLRYADDTTLLAEREEELKSLLMKVKEDSGQSWLKTQHSKNWDHGIQSHHFTANRWGKNENIDRLLSWAPKSLWIVTATMKLKDACSLKEKLWQI